MNNTQSSFTIIQPTIAEIFGLETHEVTPRSSFHLDFNASPDDMHRLREQLDELLDTSLPELTPTYPETVNDLLIIIEDSLL